VIKIAKKRKLNLLLAISGILFFILLPGVNANYTENIVIDGSLDSEYCLISQTDNYSLYFANSNDYNYVFLSTNFNLTNRTIEFSSGEFNYDISPEEVSFDFLHSVHSNDTLEIGVSRASIGDTFEISIEGLGFSILIIDPSSAPADQDNDEDDDEKDKDEKDDEVLNETINPVGGFQKWWDEFITPNAWWLWIPLGLNIGIFMIWIMKYIENPVIFVRDRKNKKFKDKKLGRVVECIQAEEPLDSYWKISFKSNKGVKEYYCKYNFESLKRWIETTKLPPFEKYMGHVIPLKINLPESLQPVLKKRRKKVKRKHFTDKLGKYRKDYWNGFKYNFFRFCCIIIPSGWFGYKLKNTIKYKTVKDKKGNVMKKKTIKVLVHEATLKHITTVKDMKYKAKSYESGEVETISHSENALPLYLIEAIKKDKDYIEMVEESDAYEIIQTYDNPEDAMNQIISKAELQSIHELEMQEMMLRFELSEKTLFEANDRLRKVKSENWQNIEKALKTKENEAILNNDILMQITARAIGLKEVLGTDKEAIEKAITSVISEHFGKERNDLVADNAKYKKEVELLTDIVNDLRVMLKSGSNGDSKRIQIGPIEPVKDNLDIN